MRGARGFVTWGTLKARPRGRLSEARPNGERAKMEIRRYIIIIFGLTAPFRVLFQVRCEPIEKSFVPELAILRFENPVAFVGEK
jgi:hypothetical protein